MKKWTRIFSLFTIGVLLALTGAAASEGKAVTVKGEVVDLQCYLVHPDAGSGSGHAGCAEMCMKNGLPIGLAADNGALYLLLGPGHDSAADIVLQYAGKTVSVTGTQVERNGLKAIQIQKVVE